MGNRLQRLRRQTGIFLKNLGVTRAENGILDGGGTQRYEGNGRLLRRRCRARRQCRVECRGQLNGPVTNSAPYFALEFGL